ncbi:TPA: autotransporter domain-containing protein, partial [Escherichia coli]|nr:autotransporter domain-containing protein [Escherichia coli]
TLVVASELARSRGKRAGVAIALSLAAVTSVPALAADTVVQAGETVSGGTLTNHDNQIVLGTANGMTISTGLEYGPDNEANTGGQWIQNGGIANNTTVTGGGLQRVNAGGSVSDTVISAGGGQSLQGQAVNTTLNGGKQWVHEGGIATGTVINEKGWQAVKSGAVATDTVVNTGAEGGPDAENGDNAGYVKFGHGSAQHVRAGFRLGSHNDMSFGEGTSSRDTLRDSTKHGVSELPVNWWVQPSVIRTFSSRGDMSMGTAAAGSNMTFSPSRNGTSLDLQAGLEARVRENITLGVQAGYAHSVSGSSAEGYNGQATLNVTF